MKHLGAISIRSAKSVREARKKIFAVAEMLTLGPLDATRIATAVSEIARSCLHNGDQPRLELHAMSDSRGTALLVDLLDVDASKGIGRAKDLFESIESHRDGQGRSFIRASTLTTPLPLTPRLIADLQAIVQKKGRDELVAEVRSKNAELQESLDNLRKTRSAKERMESELNIGREIQMSMLPLRFPAFPERKDFDVHAALYPAREVGGDFYDLFLIDENHFCFCVGDVSGKGVPAALFMAVTKTLIKSRAANDLSPASILSHVNSELSHRNESSMFVTVFLAILDLATGDLAYGNAGHNPPYLKRPVGELLRLDQRHGPVIGAVDGLAYSQSHLDLEGGDLLFLYTDGVTEAMDIENQLYSDERLERVLRDMDASTVEESVRVGVEDVWEFQGDAEQADDITVLSVFYAGRTEEIESRRLELTITNRLDEIERVNEAFSEFAERHGIEKKTRSSLQLVFDELLNNTISYGYDDEEIHEIDLAVTLSDTRLHATISDDGRPFNPFDARTPDTRLSVDDRPIGGLGVHLVRNMMDQVSYERRGSNNVVHLEKTL